MDYKYIEQLMERYWQGDTSLQEEEILRTFFSQDDVPASLRCYQPLFVCQMAEKQLQPLGDDFDEWVLALIDEEPTVRAHTITLTERLMPLFKAAAVVAIILTLGNAARLSMQPVMNEEINYADYKDTYQDPAMAYDNVENALQLVSAGMGQAQKADSLMSLLDLRADSIKTE